MSSIVSVSYAYILTIDSRWFFSPSSLQAFANMTLATRRALCAVMVFAVVEKAGTIVMNDGEELDSWSVILNGHVEITRPDGTIEHLHMGDR